MILLCGSSSEMPTSPLQFPVRVVDIDDWSWRRLWRYSTMLVDLKGRLVVDLLEDRSVASAAQWLERHPSVEIVSRYLCASARLSKRLHNLSVQHSAA